VDTADTDDAGRASHEGDGSKETRAVMRSGVFAVLAIRKPQIAQVNFFEWTGKSRRAGQSPAGSTAVWLAMRTKVLLAASLSVST
jgi:hypothetical protein